MSDDQALLMRYARSRDAEAYAQLVKRYSGLVFSVACRVTKNTTTAEDVTQDCFLKLARQAASIHSSLPCWLHRVALNRSLEVMRNEATRYRHEVLASMTSVPDHQPSWNEIAPFVDDALAKLPNELREPLVQHFLLGRTQIQIAINLCVDKATVSRRLRQGIERLRTHLKQAGIVCGSVTISTALAKNATAAVPARLATSLMKMTMAGISDTRTHILPTWIKSVLLKKTAIVIMATSVIFAVSIATPVIITEVNQAIQSVTKESLVKGLILHFSFDEADLNGTVIDASGAGNNGKALGVRWTPDGKNGGAYQFAADGDQIEVKNNDSLNSQQITLAAWIKTSYTDAIWRRIFDKSYNTGYALSITGDWQGRNWRGMCSLEIGPGTHVSMAHLVVADGKWHHLVATCDGTEQKLYVDGKPQGESLRWNAPRQVLASDFNLVIGCNRSNLQENDLGMSFRGLIDEPMIWNRALSPKEVEFLFESQR